MASSAALQRPHQFWPCYDARKGYHPSTLASKGQDLGQWRDTLSSALSKICFPPHSPGNAHSIMLSAGMHVRVHMQGGILQDAFASSRWQRTCDAPS